MDSLHAVSDLSRELTRSPVVAGLDNLDPAVGSDEDRFLVVVDHAFVIPIDDSEATRYTGDIRLAPCQKDPVVVSLVEALSVGLPTHAY